MYGNCKKNCLYNRLLCHKVHHVSLNFSKQILLAQGITFTILCLETVRKDALRLLYACARAHTLSPLYNLTILAHRVYFAHVNVHCIIFSMYIYTRWKPISHMHHTNATDTQQFLNYIKTWAANCSFISTRPDAKLRFVSSLCLSFSFSFVCMFQMVLFCYTF